MENLLRQRDELQAKIRELDDLAATGTEKILQAIKNQRWFFFKNNKYILFDKDTAFLWANLDYFPYNPRDGWYYTEDAEPLMKQINSQRWGGFNCWRIPGFWEFLKMIMDKSFPFQRGQEWEILEKAFWFIYDNGYYSDKIYLHSTKSSERPTPKRWSDGRILPCNNVLVPNEYEQNISSTNRFYSDKQKLQFTLEIFTRNNLVPMFNNYEANNLYQKIYVDKAIDKKFQLVRQLAELDRKIAEAKKFAEEEAQRKRLEASKPKLTANFDYKPILAKYDAKEIDKSAIKYFSASRKVADEILNILQEYETAQKETIAEFLKIALKLNAKYVDNPNLTPEENFLLAERQKFLAQRLELGTDNPKRKILSVKAQAEKFSERLEKINDSENYFAELAALESEPRPSFELLVENLARIISDAQRKVDFFAEHKNLVANVVSTWAAWNDSYKTFKTSLHEELIATCRDEGIDEEIFAAWCDDWQKKRFAIEQRFLPLVEFALKGNLLNSLEDALKISQ